MGPIHLVMLDIKLRLKIFAWHKHQEVCSMSSPSVKEFDWHQAQVSRIKQILFKLGLASSKIPWHLGLTSRKIPWHLILMSNVPVSNTSLSWIMASKWAWCQSELLDTWAWHQANFLDTWGWCQTSQVKQISLITVLDIKQNSLTLLAWHQAKILDLTWDWCHQAKPDELTHYIWLTYKLYYVLMQCAFVCGNYSCLPTYLMYNSNENSRVAQSKWDPFLN